MRCSACDTENETGARFCDACGAALAAVCPGCGSANRPTARFCAGCGASLAGAPEESAKGATADAAARPTGPATAPRQAERRLVSLLFADLVGFTTFAEGRDPEADHAQQVRIPQSVAPPAAVLDPVEPEVRSAIDRSREILEQLRAAPLLARLDGILGSRSPATPRAADRESSPVSSRRT